MRLGIFGGSFDPPHLAHRALARVAGNALALDELLWIPAGQPWQKPRSITPAAHREAMVALSLADTASWRLESCELLRTGPSYMVDTLADIQSRLAYCTAQCFLIIGQDQLSGLHTWHRFAELLSRVTLAVAGRPGSGPTLDAKVQQAAQQAVPLPPMHLSSTDIRQRVATGQPIEHMVLPAVARYIAQHGLYASP